MVEVIVGPRQALPMPYLVKIPGITEEMFEELVDEDLRAELLDRVLIVHSPATVRNDDLSGFLRSLLRLFAEDRGLGNVYGPDSIIHLASCRKFAPDLYFVRSDRVLTPRPKEFEGSPDLVVEVLSPSNREYDLEDKRSAYRQARVKETWFVDEEEQRILVDSLRGRRYVEQVVTTGQAASRAAPGFWMDVSWLWAEPRPALLACLQAILAGK